jgi:hypothetical protein
MAPNTRSWRRHFLFVAVGIVAIGWAVGHFSEERPASSRPASVATLGATKSSSHALEPGKYWVSAERLTRHTCPNEACGVVGRLFFREAVDVAEQNGGWARVSRYYSAACENGRSTYVDEGRDSCSVQNGIVDGNFAEWVSSDDLTAVRPDDPAENASQYEKMIAQSDDFGRYRVVFAQSAHKLISNGTCSETDFVEMGGWVKSSNLPNRPIYFTYCGGMTAANRLYLDASSGRVSREP